MNELNWRIQRYNNLETIWYKCYPQTFFFRVKYYLPFFSFKETNTQWRRKESKVIYLRKTINSNADKGVRKGIKHTTKQSIRMREKQ